MHACDAPYDDVTGCYDDGGGQERDRHIGDPVHWVRADIEVTRDLIFIEFISADTNDWQDPNHAA